MAEEHTSSVARIVAIGPETTPGTAVNPTKQLSSVDLRGKIATDITSFRAAGSKFTTVHSLGKESSEWDVSSDAPCFDELAHLLCSLVKNVSPTGSASAGYTWTFTPTYNAEDTRKTFTVQEGHELSPTDVAHQATYGIVTGLTFDIDRNGTKLGGTMIARNMTSVSFSGSPTAVPTIPVLARDWGVWLDTAASGLGTTRLTRVLSAKVAFEDMIAPLWTVDDSLDSWSTHVETAPKCTVELTMQAESTAMALLPVMQAGSKRYLRIQNTSGTLAGSSSGYYSLTFDVCGEISEVGDFGDDQDVYTISWTFEATHDSAWGKPFTIAVVNAQSAL